MTVIPYKDLQLGKKEQVRLMFNTISNRYDFLNHFLSFGIDKIWRKKTIAYLANTHPKTILDIATGTADLAIEALSLNPDKITGIDISEDMLAIAKRKISEKNLQHKIELLTGDSENLKFSDNTFDAITVAFGVRNFENLEKGLREMYRVLKPGGMAVILEFSHPENPVIKKLYQFYSNKICPVVGRIISRDKSAYSYLHNSVMDFPSGEKFTRIVSNNGFKEINCKPVTFGVATIYTGRKN